MEICPYYVGTKGSFKQTIFLYVFKQIKQHTRVKKFLKVLSNKLPYAMERTITDGTNNQRHVYPEYDDCPGRGCSPRRRQI
jgi:hypothetical protein